VEGLQSRKQEGGKAKCMRKMQVRAKADDLEVAKTSIQFRTVFPFDSHLLNLEDSSSCPD